MSALILAVAACAFGAGGACAAALATLEACACRARRAHAKLIHETAKNGGEALHDRTLRFAWVISRQLAFHATTPLSLAVRDERATRTRGGVFFARHERAAGCAGKVSVEGFCEARARLALGFGLVGGLVGLLVSSETAVAAGALGAVVGWRRVFQSMCASERRRACEAQRHLPEMLEVVALGLRSGLTFEKSFEAYGRHFDSGFARDCAAVARTWNLGLETREEALRDFSASYACNQLARTVEIVLRSLRFGSALAERLEDAAAQARAEYRSALEERAAKAPVKMMLPTGALILPAMLLLVMGPILLELAVGF